jgi:AcrR family transcriptional regulator
MLSVITFYVLTVNIGFNFLERCFDLSQSSKKKQKTKRNHNIGYHHGDLRSSLIDKAIEMLNDCSPEDLSLRELARLAGVSQAAPYRHFKDKEDLFASIAQQGFEIKLKYMLSAMEKFKDDPNELFFQCGLSYFKMGQKHPQHFKLMFGSNVAPNLNHPELMKAACATFVCLKEMIVMGQSAGLIGSGDPFHKAMNCWSVVHGFTMLYCNQRLTWLGISTKNCESALRVLLSQHLLGSKTEILSDVFSVQLFQTKESLAIYEQIKDLKILK